jgi:hypothetical protein
MVRVKIEVEVKGNKFELTEEEAIELRDELDEALGVEDLECVPMLPYIPYIPTPVYPTPWEYTPWVYPYTTCELTITSDNKGICETTTDGVIDCILTGNTLCGCK